MAGTRRHGCGGRALRLACGRLTLHGKVPYFALQSLPVDLGVHMSIPEDETMDVVQAAVMLDQTERSTQQALRIRYAPIYLAWGVAWLVGLGAMWLSVRGQRPYSGPSGVSAAV